MLVNSEKTPILPTTSSTYQDVCSSEICSVKFIKSIPWMTAQYTMPILTGLAAYSGIDKPFTYIISGAGITMNSMSICYHAINQANKHHCGKSEGLPYNIKIAVCTGALVFSAYTIVYPQIFGVSDLGNND